MGVSIDDRSNYLWVNVSSFIAFDHSIMKYLYIFFPKMVPNIYVKIRNGRSAANSRQGNYCMLNGQWSMLALSTTQDCVNSLVVQENPSKAAKSSQISRLAGSRLMHSNKSGLPGSIRSTVQSFCRIKN